MLIPNVGPYSFIPYSQESVINKSTKDDNSRPFSITTFLEDNRARTKHIYLTIGVDESFSIKTENNTINFYLEKNSDGQLISLIAGCFAKSYKEALKLVYHLIQRILSQWSFKYKRPIGFYEIRILDKTHNATWRLPHTAPNTLPDIDFPIVIMAESPLSSLITVFKEAMNSQTSSARFLNYFKIVEAYPSNGPFYEMNRYCKVNNIKNMRRSGVVTEELLNGAYTQKYHEMFLNKKFTWCKSHLIELRNAIAHPFLKNKSYIDLDNLETQACISAYANLLERIAINILNEEYFIWGQLSEDPKFEQAVESYLG
jgi:hypothetical protein